MAKEVIDMDRKALIIITRLLTGLTMITKICRGKSILLKQVEVNTV